MVVIIFVGSVLSVQFLVSLLSSIGEIHWKTGGYIGDLNWLLGY